MADKNQNQYHPAEVNGYHRSDQESLEEIEEARRKKKMKWTIGIIAFIIFQTSPSFNMSFVAPIRVKNTNWGPFKYDASTVNFTYGDVQVGQATIPKAKANFKSTKKIDVLVTLNSGALPTSSNLGSELSSGVITLNSQGELKGKVTVMFMFKKTKISKMNCTIKISTSAKEVKSLHCS
ncbi:hypothetical protein EUGRSUZ_E00791 [Eucalyptus grandis]|uniref:Late embryogenesis abundant protein LEA-2 subgroup domain-containing protein n=2 Tax=Eucalyptus grandis TaxID=71139 RepID=A0A059C1K0_EUCGR|nr:hypothetical protein EUGRSUZ_E00791 [Eucalyptus grandis]